MFVIFTLVTQLSHFSPFKREHKEEKLQPGVYFTDNPYLPFQGEGEETSLAMKGKITKKTKRKGEKRKKKREKKIVLYMPKIEPRTSYTPGHFVTTTPSGNIL